MGRRRKGRDVNGILVLDKPSGLTSNRALQRIKGMFFARKAGHTGSLDPLASGVLPICFGHATKISGLLLDAAKSYEVVGTYGARCDTGDADGTVVETSEKQPDDAALADIVPRFIGEQLQVPPMYSALKQDGKRLYSLARQGKTVERPPRTITIYSMDILPAQAGTFSLRVSCSKGTYIRALVEDMAEAMGALAHVSALRRVVAGPFAAHHQVSMEQIEFLHEHDRDALDELLLPLDAALPDWPVVTLDQDTGFYLLNGQPVQAPDAPREGSVRVYVEGTGLVGLGEVLGDGRIAPRRLFR